MVGAYRFALNFTGQELILRKRVDSVNMKRYLNVDGDNMKTLWQVSEPLTATGIAMLPLLVLSVIGMVADPRTITNVPAWLKPAKFATSIAIYSFTLAWMFRYLPAWPRLKSITGWITAIVMIVEIAIIDLQAARGTTSHFNTATLFDRTLFAIMGISILIAWGASIAITVALFRQPFRDPAMGWAIRLGMLISVLGLATGGLMVSPTHAQLAGYRATHNLPVSGAHTVGAPDGGPGMPGTGWSRQHGDLRVPHFFGMHAMQILPLLAWLLKPKRSGMVIALAAGYVFLFAILVVQALSGTPLLGGA